MKEQTKDRLKGSVVFLLVFVLIAFGGYSAVKSIESKQTDTSNKISQQIAQLSDKVVIFRNRHDIHEIDTQDLLQSVDTNNQLLSESVRNQKDGLEAFGDLKKILDNYQKIEKKVEAKETVDTNSLMRTIDAWKAEYYESERQRQQAEEDRDYWRNRYRNNCQ